jgi:hypothetical protein
MVLVERGLKQDIKAHVDVEFAVTGVHATIRAPLNANAASSIPTTES